MPGIPLYIIGLSGIRRTDLHHIIPAGANTGISSGRLRAVSLPGPVYFPVIIDLCFIFSAYTVQYPTFLGLVSIVNEIPPIELEV